MNILLILVPIALLLGLVGLAAFLWTVRTRQYEDLDGAASRILIDEEEDGQDAKTEDSESLR